MPMMITNWYDLETGSMKLDVWPGGGGLTGVESKYPESILNAGTHSVI